ncbi:SNF2-related protein [Candidatus Margulisiibacteriota bacterium]
MKSRNILNLFSQILNKADYQAMSEGKKYFSYGAVENLIISPRKITAEVAGQYGYNVVLSVRDDGVKNASCSCPSYRHPCKHIVATLLAAHKYTHQHPSVFAKFKTQNREYLQLIDIKGECVRLKVMAGRLKDKLKDISHTEKAKDKILALTGEIKLEDDYFLVKKRRFAALLEERQDNDYISYFKDILLPDRKSLSIDYPMDEAKPALRLRQDGADLILELKYKGKYYPLGAENFISHTVSNQEDRQPEIMDYDEFDHDRFDYEPDFDNDYDYENSSKVESATFDSIYFTGRELVALGHSDLILQFSKVKKGSSAHSMLVNYAVETLMKNYQFEGFGSFPAPPLKVKKPDVRIKLNEIQARRNWIILNVKVEYIYDNQVVFPGNPARFLSYDNDYFLRDREYEEKVLEKIFGKTGRYSGPLESERALEFLMEKLPKLPPDWKIEKDLNYYDFETDQDIEFKLKPRDDGDWFSASFKVPKKIRKVFSKKLIQNILRKKPKYINVGGKWMACSGNLINSISMAYFIGPHVLQSGFEKISPFQVMGLWHYLQQNKKFKAPEKVIQSIDKLRSFKEIKMPAFHNKLDKILRPYQKEGVAWLEFLHDHNISGILCDDMGLGKTLQTLAFLYHLKQKKQLKQCLIVVPTSAVGSWLMEIEKFLPDFKVAVIEGTNREKIYKDWSDNELYITSYTIFSKDVEKINKKKINYLILDEAQFIKNANTKRARALFAVKSERRLAMTGTPLENRLSDLWSAFHFIMPGYMGSLEYFRDTYQNPIEKRGESKLLLQLRDRIRPFLLRRLKEEVEKELPPKTEIPIFCELTEDQKKVYLHTLSLVRQEVFANIKEKGLKQSYIHIFAALTKLRQICNHPSLILDKPDPKLLSGKFETFKEHLLEVLAENHYVLVFSQFTSMLAYIRKWLEKEGIKYLYLDGATKKRAELVKEFGKAKYPVFLISLKAGGTALTLTQADYVMHFDPWWNPAVENQATDRAHRIGQNKHVFVYKFYTKGTIEEKILHLQKKKQKMFNDIMDGSLSKAFQLSQTDVEEILTPNF